MAINSPYQVPVIQTSYAKILVQIFTDHGPDSHKLLEDLRLPPDSDRSQKVTLCHQSRSSDWIYLTSSQLGVSRFTDVLGLAFRRRIIPYVLHQFTEFETIGDALNTSTQSSLMTLQAAVRRFRCRTRAELVLPNIARRAFIYVPMGRSVCHHLHHWADHDFIQSPWQPTKLRLQGHDTDIVKTLVPSNCQLFIDHSSTAVMIPDEILQLPIRLTAKDLSNKPAIVEWHTQLTDSVYELLQPYMKEQDLSLEEAAELL